jgi:hypothetical protein
MIYRAMESLPDLVRDSKLETRFTNNPYTVHTYHETDLNTKRRVVGREEYWHRQKPIGSGAFGHVWLEKCVNGNCGIDVRAVKEIVTDNRRGLKPIDYSRELEAMAKFSHPRVRVQAILIMSNDV